MKNGEFQREPAEHTPQQPLERTVKYDSYCNVTAGYAEYVRNTKRLEAPDNSFAPVVIVPFRVLQVEEGPCASAKESNGMPARLGERVVTSAATIAVIPLRRVRPG